MFRLCQALAALSRLFWSQQVGLLLGRGLLASRRVAPAADRGLSERERRSWGPRVPLLSGMGVIGDQTRVCFIGRWVLYH